MVIQCINSIKYYSIIYNKTNVKMELCLNKDKSIDYSLLTRPVCQAKKREYFFLVQIKKKTRKMH